ncbi:hypothetical protein [Cytobacillus kochii]
MEVIDSKPFYEFELNMLALLQCDNNNARELITDLYKINKNCHEEYSAIINTSLSINNRIKKTIEKELETSRRHINEMLEDKDFDEEDDYNIYKISQMVSLREDGFRLLEREIEIQSISSIVMLLSLSESTLFEIINKFSSFDKEKFPDIKSVFKRDKGIAKYLKYLDKYLNEDEENFIVGKPIYNELLHWANLRNNIVHSSNRYNDELYAKSLKLNIQIKYSRRYNKFCFETKSVIQLGMLVGQILNICIVEGFYKYFGEDFLEISETFSPPIIID